MRNLPQHARARADSGVGLAEIVVAVAIFGILVAAFVPLLVSSFRSERLSRSVATASQLADQQMANVTATTNCTGLSSTLGDSTQTVANTTWYVRNTASPSLACPLSTGASYTVTTAIYDNSGRTGTPVAQASTIRFVAAGS